MRDAQHFGHACVQPGIGEFALAVEPEEVGEFAFVQAAVLVCDGLEVLQDFGAGVLRGFEKIAHDAFADAGGSGLRDTLTGEDRGGGGLGGQRRGCSHDGIADGHVGSDGIGSSRECGFDFGTAAHDGGGGGAVAHFSHFDTELRGVIQLGLDLSFFLIVSAIHSGVFKLSMSKDLDSLRAKAGEHR